MGQITPVLDVTLSWPAPPDSWVWRYCDRLLMVLWLWMWVRCMVWPAGQVASGNADPFLYVWLAFWTLGGGVCVWAQSTIIALTM